MVSILFGDFKRLEIGKTRGLESFLEYFMTFISVQLISPNCLIYIRQDRKSDILSGEGKL
jgi:hypothetical protein